MTNKAWMLLLVFVAILGAYWAYRVYAPASLPGATEHTVQIAAPETRRNANNGREASWLKPALPMTLREALAKIPHPHLRPDQRFLEAVAFVSSFPAVPAQSVAAADFKDGMWAVQEGNLMLGALPPYADFSDAMTLLHSVTQRKAGAVHADCKLPDSALASQVTIFDEKILENALYKLNGEYRAGTPEPANLYLAAQAMTRLAYLEDDKTGTADALYGKAMALVAIAEAACDTPMPEEESLLAASMGYSAAAATAVEKLPGQDAWKLYFLREDDDLERMARLNPDSLSASYFWIRRLADLGRSQDWLAWLKERYSGMTTPVYIMDTDMALPGRPPIQLYARYMPLLVLSALPGSENIKVAPVDPVADPAAAIRLFDTGVPFIGKVATGPYLTAADITAYYRGFFYSGLYEEGYLLIDFLDSMDDAKQYDQLLASASGEAGQEFYRWYDAKVRANQGTLSLPALMQDMATSKMFSSGLYYNSWSDTAGHLGNLNSSVRNSVWQLDTLFDSRAPMRWDYGQLLKWVYDFPDYEDTFASLAAQESADAPVNRLAVYAYQGEVEKLLQVANNPKLSKATRVTALADIPEGVGAQQSIRSAYQGIIKNYPEGENVYRQYIKFLQRSNDYPDIERIARLWLVSQPPGDTGFSYDDASVFLASAEAHQGQLDQAWTTISQVTFADGATPATGQAAYVVNFYANVLSEASYIAKMRKDFATAEFLGRTVAQRYPNDLADQMPLVKVLWAEQRYADAAEYLSHWPYPIAAWQWYHVIGAEMAKTFNGNPQAAAAAFDAIVNAKPRRPDPFEVNGLVLATGKADPAVGFALVQAASQQTPSVNFLMLVEGYGYLERTKGAQTAFAWLQSKLPDRLTPQQREFIAGMGYQNGNYELLWSLYPPEVAVPDADYIWLLRAAADMQNAVLSARQQTELQRHFIQAGDSWYDTLGKYVMHEVGDKAIVDSKLDAHKLSEASYYMALRALSEKNYRNAQEWLEVDSDTHQAGNGEFQWGQSLQSYWEVKNESLSVLDQQGELYRDKYQ